RQLRARPRVPIHQAAEHARARRFADGGRDARNSRVRVIFETLPVVRGDIHTFMVNEVFARGNQDNVSRRGGRGTSVTIGAAEAEARLSKVQRARF
ncbi:MAG: hypothetical protein WB813_11370, partial [Candidatus Acidiferrales bacterium]